MYFIVLHPYYKLTYIKLAWGGEKEQVEEKAVGNKDVKNWQDKARKILEDTVCVVLWDTHQDFNEIPSQMESYWRTQLKAHNRAPPNTAIASSDAACASSFLSEYDCHHQMLLMLEEEGWAVELRRYLKDIPIDVTRDSDIIEWWQGHCVMSLCYNYLSAYLGTLLTLPNACMNHFLLKPLQYLANSFSQLVNKQLRNTAHLGSRKFEELQIMKFAWWNCYVP